MLARVKIIRVNNLTVNVFQKHCLSLKGFEMFFTYQFRLVMEPVQDDLSGRREGDVKIIILGDTAVGKSKCVSYREMPHETPFAFARPS